MFLSKLDTYFGFSSKSFYELFSILCHKFDLPACNNALSLSILYIMGPIIYEVAFDFSRQIQSYRIEVVHILLIKLFCSTKNEIAFFIEILSIILGITIY